MQVNENSVKQEKSNTNLQMADYSKVPDFGLVLKRATSVVISLLLILLNLYHVNNLQTSRPLPQKYLTIYCTDMSKVY